LYRVQARFLSVSQPGTKLASAPAFEQAGETHSEKRQSNGARLLHSPQIELSSGRRNWQGIAIAGKVAFYASELPSVTQAENREHCA
jgi:hypothetical protein